MKTLMTECSDRQTTCLTAQGPRALAAGGTPRWLRAVAFGVALLGSPWTLWAAGPAPVDLLSTAHFMILSGAAITSTGGGQINGDVGASPIAGSAIGVTCAQVNGIIYAVDASGPPCAVIDSSLLTTAKGDLTTAYNDAAGRTPVPSGPNLNPGLIPGSGNIGGMNLPPGLYKFTVTALITGADVTLTGGPDDVWIFQCSQDLQLGSGMKVILAGGAQADHVFWQVGTSAVLGTFSSFQGTILADQAITMNTSSTIVGRLLAFSAGVTFNGTSAAVPAPEIGVEQPAGTDLLDGFNTNDFGSVLVGTNRSLTFIITNSGTADLTGLGITIDGADAASFTVTTNPVAPVNPGSNTTFTVRFTPLTTGLKTAALHIANNDSDENPFDLVLTGNGIAPEIAVEQPVGTDLLDGFNTNDFGSVVVGTNRSLTFTITNSGTADLTGLGILIDGADAASFVVTTNPVAPVGPGSNTTFTVRFAPLSPGLKTAGLHITNNDSNENPFDLVLTGTGAAPEIAVEQPAGTDLTDGIGTQDFGSVVVGTNRSLTFIITNSGTADLTGLGIIIDGADAASFAVTANPVAPVGPGSNTTFTVRFTPLSPGLKTAALHIANNDSNENPFDINLTGTGALVAAPEIGVEQPAGTDLTDGVSTKNFGAVALGTNSSLTFIITNSGTAELTGLGIIIDGADAASFIVTTNPVAPVGPGSNTTFTVRFTPLTTGPKTAALHIANNDSNENPFDINLTGTVTAPEIGVAQPAGTDLTDGVSTKNFGSVALGTNASLTFIITNSGTADLTGLGIVIDGADAASFVVTTNPVAPVGPGSNTMFTVRFTPLTSGPKTAALHIANNDSNENPFDINLAATGTAPEIGVAQPAGTDLTDGVSTKNFGSVVVGTNTSLTFIITNSGTADLTGLGIIIDGADAASFTVTTNPVAPVGPGSNTTFTVRFTPLTTGPKTAALHIANNDSNENPFDIIITGTGALVAAPEIGVDQPAGTNLVDGVGTKDFGPVVVGTNTSLTFVITNSGTANLTGLGIIIDGADAASFVVVTNPVVPVGPGSNTTFTVRFIPLTAGLKTAALHIANNDSDENPFDINLTGTGVNGGFEVSTNVHVFSASPIKLNPQTGLFEQTVRVTNSGPDTITGIRLLIYGLPADVQVYNASGSTNGTPFVQYGLPLASGGTVDFVIEYYRANRRAIPQPTFVVQSIAPVSATVTGTLMPIDRSVQLGDGRFLIEFTSVPGKRYAVQYSSDMQTWKTAEPIITAPSNRVQWYDDGPPKTESKPTSVGSRFYRVLSLP